MKSQLYKKARYLSYFTVGYNVLEGVVAIMVGGFVGSIALVGFGFDSFVESLSGGVMLWRFGRHHEMSEADEERVEKRAIELVSYTFFILGVYTVFESVKKLSLHDAAAPSLIGIWIAVLSLGIMPSLFFLKHKTGKLLKSKSLVADARQTLACMFMSVALLVGLGLNYLYGWWWADPLTGLLIGMILLKEGYATFKERKVCSC